MINIKFDYLIYLRLIQGLFIRSYFAPDEYWQYQEIPHYYIFNKGYLTYEWDMKQSQYAPMRSPLYHLPIQLLYYILKSLNLDYGWLIAYSPRILSSLIAGLFDIYMIKLINLIYQQELKKIKKINNLFFFVIYGLWFLNFTLTRVLINSFETIIFTMSFYYWKLAIKQQNKNLSKYSLFFYLLLIINFVSRPTSVIIYIPILAIDILQNYSSGKKQFLYDILKNIILLMICIFSSLVLDYIYYKKLVSSAYNFLYFNLAKDGASFYGVHNKYFYFQAFIPSQFNIWLFFIIKSLKGEISKLQYKLNQKQFQKNILQRLVHKFCLICQQFEFLIISLFLVLILSISKHKEDRFILPIYPLMILQIFKYILNNNHNYQKILKYVKMIFLCNLAAFIIIENVHKIGSLKSLDYLRNMEIKGNIKQNILFLNQCHQTPYYSFLHNKNYELKMLDCSPNFERAKKEINEQTIFENNPIRYFNNLKFQADYILISEDYYQHLINNKIQYINQYVKIQSFNHMIQIIKEYPYFKMDQLYILQKQ